jgi:hypothetical protein
VFPLQNGFTFTTATFNLFTDQVSGIPVTINAFNTQGATFSESFTLENGSNTFGIVASEVERWISCRVFSSVGVSEFRQLRLGGVSQIVSPVPEPGTWAMMLIGFGGLGYSMRRRPKLSARIRFA